MEQTPRKILVWEKTGRCAPPAPPRPKKAFAVPIGNINNIKIKHYEKTQFGNKSRKLYSFSLETSGFWPRKRAPVFLGSLPCQTGRCAPPPPDHRSFAASYSTPKNIYMLSNLGRLRQGLFSIHWTTEAMEVPCPPASPIAASLILPAIFLYQCDQTPYFFRFFLFL
jgi:hypothetical protein